jgi:hypothetical protein
MQTAHTRPFLDCQAEIVADKRAARRAWIGYGQHTRHLAESVDLLGRVHWIPHEWSCESLAPPAQRPTRCTCTPAETSIQKFVRPTVLREHSRVGRTFCASVVERHGHCAARSCRDRRLELIGRSPGVLIVVHNLWFVVDWVNSSDADGHTYSAVICRLVHDFLGMYSSHPRAAELSPSGSTFPA